MAEAINTLAGLIQINNLNNADLNVSDLLQDAPLIAALTAVEASNGTNHSYLKETVAEGVAFRAINAGVTNANSQDEEVSIVLKALDAAYDVDTAFTQKVRGGLEAYLEKRTMRKLAAAFSYSEKQIIYGTGNAAGGFAGLLTSAYLNGLTDDMVIQPGTPGTTADEQSSVLFLRSTEDDVAYVAGNDGQIEVYDPVLISKVEDPGTTNTTYGAWFVNILGYGGVQYGSQFSAGRICNVETSLTDDDLGSMLSKFPSNRQPNIISMNRASLELLRSSRTAVNTVGAPAPTPSDYMGIPIIPTDSFTQTEAIVA